MEHHREQSQRSQQSAESDSAARMGPPELTPKTANKIDEGRDLPSGIINDSSRFYLERQGSGGSTSDARRPRCVACGQIIDVFERGSDTS